MRYALAAALILTPAVASADTYELRNQSTELTMTVGAPDARVCVAFPRDKRSGSCAELDLSSLTDAEGQTTVVVMRPEWSLTVIATGSDALQRGELTPREARELQGDVVRQLRKIPGFRHEPFEPLTINGVQAFRLRAEYGSDRSHFYLFVGDDGLTTLRFVYPPENEAEALPLIDAIVATARARPARSTHLRMGPPILSLLAGAPLVLLAAALANRKRAA